ncbi:hypothetical protein CCR75_009817 [Bremia lactucae]|uniref:Uncharacterized protein n=1 Tax=Bremia lactucae TaxID=4779 RepID=A0A976IKI0_BRELC|nr:hypothetical protein CCR75_009817 [Bremia lactucae]
MSLQLSTSHESVTAAAKLGILREITQSDSSEKDTNKKKHNFGSCCSVFRYILHDVRCCNFVGTVYLMDAEAIRHLVEEKFSS